jgi:heme/copper-type cytochrome/quinol oxidase subunit 4
MKKMYSKINLRTILLGVFVYFTIMGIFVIISNTAASTNNNIILFISDMIQVLISIGFILFINHSYNIYNEMKNNQPKKEQK